MCVKPNKIKNCKKVLFVIQSTRNLSYNVHLIEHLLAKNLVVHLHYDNHFSHADLKPLEQLCKEYPRLHHAPIKHKKGMFLKWALREVITYNWYNRRLDQSAYFRDRWANYMGYIFRVLMTLKPLQTTIRSKFLFHVMQFVNKRVSVDKAILGAMENIEPDLVIASPANMRRSLEVEYLSSAKFLGVPTAVVVLSWDNLTNKGLFHCEPDQYFVWNETHKTELLNIHKTQKTIHVVGASLFEKWFFERRLKTTSSEPYVLYFGSSINITKNENALLQKLRKTLPSDIALKFRPHPQVRLNYTNSQIDGVQYLLNSEMVETKEQVKEQAKLIKNALFCTGINTSAFLDSLILKTPVFYFRSQGHSQTQDESAHFMKMAEKGYFLDINNFNHEQLLRFKYTQEFSEINKRFIETEIFMKNQKPSHRIMKELFDD